MDRETRVIGYTLKCEKAQEVEFRKVLSIDGLPDMVMAITDGPKRNIMIATGHDSNLYSVY